MRADGRSHCSRGTTASTARGRDLSLLEARHLGTTLARIHNGLATVLPPVPQPLFVPTKSAELASRRSRAASAESTPTTVPRRLRRTHRISALANGGASSPRWPTCVRGLRFLALSATSTATSIWETSSGALWSGTVRSPLSWTGRRRRSDRPGTNWSAPRWCSSPTRTPVCWIWTPYAPSSADTPRCARSSLQREYTRPSHRVWWERLTDFWIPVWRYELGGERADSLFPGTFALVPWWTENYDKVLEAFLDGAKPRTPPRASGASPMLRWLADAVTEATTASPSPRSADRRLRRGRSYR